MASSFNKLNLSPKNIPDNVGIIIDDVVISNVICIGPLDNANILYKLLNAVTTPKSTPNKTVYKERLPLSVKIPKIKMQTA